MKKIIVLSLTAIFLVTLISGCLTVEKKEYRLKMTGPTSGKGTIKYINIVSQKDNDKDVSLKDFAELITDYYQGDKFEKDFPDLKNIQKKLYEENGTLVAEFTFDFDSLSHVKIFQFDKDAPYMCLIKESFNSEEYDTSNGIYNWNNLPVIFWKKNTKDFAFNTKMSIDSTKTVSLLEHFRNWEKTNK